MPGDWAGAYQGLQSPTGGEEQPEVMSHTRSIVRFLPISALVAGVGCAIGQASRADVPVAMSTSLPCSTVAVEGVTSGSGVIVDRRGLVLTAAHVVGRAGRGCFVILPDGSRMVGVAVAVNTRDDFAILKIAPGPDLYPVRLAKTFDSEQVPVVIALGHSGGRRAGGSLEIRSGRLVSRPEEISRRTMAVWTSIHLERGDSGGPLFNAAGELVAIHARSLRSPGGEYGVHVPIDLIRPALSELCRRLPSGP